MFRVTSELGPMLFQTIRIFFGGGTFSDNIFVFVLFGKRCLLKVRCYRPYCHNNTGCLNEHHHACDCDDNG